MGCVHHPSSPMVAVMNGQRYCAKCVAGMRAAAAQLDPHVTPPDCFVWYKNAAEGWQPIAGTGCAHYVAHQQSIQVGGPPNTCLNGFTYRVPLLITGKARVTGGATAVKLNDIWVQADRHHTGIVSKIDPAPAPTPAHPTPDPVIWITHASSGQHKVATNRFDQYFHGNGDFFR